MAGPTPVPSREGVQTVEGSEDPVVVDRFDTASAVVDDCLSRSSGRAIRRFRSPGRAAVRSTARNTNQQMKPQSTVVPPRT